ncbi:MAG: hypothetical protein BWZ10_01750 [candidate division BRC1 bacterium ADurb.BinA364]|nr:MAG: hypothetical protein BWZ10_01750 [candidate division BRC1 bacterium ADurb.BinA364]
MPAFVGQHQNRVVERARIAFDHLDRLVEDFAFDPAPLVVLAAEMAHDFARLALVAGQQQLQRQVRFANPPGDIEPRADDKRRRARRNALLSAQTEHIEHRPRACLGAALQLSQAMPGQRAVFANQRHDIADRSDRHQVQLLAQKRPGALRIGVDALEQRMGEFERHAHARQVLAGIGAIDAMRIDNRRGRRQLAAR